MRADGCGLWAASASETAMESTSLLICAALEWISPKVRMLIDVLIERDGRLEDAEDVALAAGFRNRYQLRRQLEREGLPNLEILAAWIRLLLWLREWERHGTRLSRGAYDKDETPRVRTRTVRELTGMTWPEVTALGTAWAVLELRRRCPGAKWGDPGEPDANDPVEVDGDRGGITERLPSSQSCNS